jgi:hypothetical protein
MMLNKRMARTTEHNFTGRIGAQVGQQVSVELPFGHFRLLGVPHAQRDHLVWRCGVVDKAHGCAGINGGTSTSSTTTSNGQPERAGLALKAQQPSYQVRLATNYRQHHVHAVTSCVIGRDNGKPVPLSVGCVWQRRFGTPCQVHRVCGIGMGMVGGSSRRPPVAKQDLCVRSELAEPLVCVPNGLQRAGGCVLCADKESRGQHSGRRAVVQRFKGGQQDLVQRVC